MKTNKQDTFCPIPWIFQAIRNNGDIRICCQANVSPNRGILRDDKGLAYNAQQGLLEESRNAELMKRVRKNMLADKWSPECNRCREEEEAGLHSRRTNELSHWDFSSEDAKLCTDPSGAIDTDETPILYYDIRFGNKCNLACRMCGPSDSDRWYNDHVALKGADFYYDSHGRVELEKKGANWVSKGKAYQWYESEDFWKSLSKLKGKLKHIYMAGGEPLMIKEHYKFLEQCLESGDSKNIILEYNTNLTILPDRVLELWQSFRQVRVGASVDGFGEVFEYQRYPGKWNVVLDNLKKLDQLGDPVISWLACTVTVYNVMHIPEFICWKLKESGFSRINSFKKKPIITHHVAHKPEFLNVRALSENQKNQVQQHFQKYREEIFPRMLSSEMVESACSILDSIERYMLSKSYFEEFGEELINYTKSLDAIRNQNGFVFLPPM